MFNLGSFFPYKAVSLGDLKRRSLAPYVLSVESWETLDSRPDIRALQEFCQLHGLHTLDLSQNPLSGEIPKELGKLEAMERLYISGTHISGPIPRELSQMHSLIYLFLPDNDLEGPMPGELGRLQLLQELHLSQNRLSGAIPKELGQMETLQKLELSANQLEGEIPKELGQLKSLRMLSLAQNRLQGRIPQELEQLRFLQELILSKNELQGSSEEIASILQSMRLEVLDLGHNSFAGELNEWRAEVVQELQLLDLSHNKFFGNLSRFVEIFCSLSPPGGSLLELRLNHNRFTGEMPPCLMQFSNLNFLALNNNRLRGSLPPIHASELVVLALHKNKLSGVLPESLHHLKRLGVLTLHENSIGGPISGLNLSTACMDNSKFRIEGMGCVRLRALVEEKGLKLHHIDPHDPVHQLKQIYANCPTLMGCDRAGTANLTLHRNRFSCAVPKSLGSSKISGLVIMGNMLGSGRELNFSWIRPEEKQSFLYYSKEVWTSNQVVIAGFVLLFFFGALCYQPRQRLEASFPHLNFGTGARVASANLGVLPEEFKKPLCLFWYGWHGVGHPSHLRAKREVRFFCHLVFGPETLGIRGLPLKCFYCFSTGHAVLREASACQRSCAYNGRSQV